MSNEIGAWGASAGVGTTAMGGAGYVANMGGLSGTTDLFSDNEDGGRNFNGRAIGLTCLQAASVCAAGAATFASVASASGAGAAVGAALGMATDAVNGGFDAYDSQKCIAELWKLDERAMSLHIRGDKDGTACHEAIHYLTGKQRMKLRKGVGKASIVGQPGVHLYRAGKAVYKFAKGTKGVNRAKYSEIIVNIAKKQTPAGEVARGIVQAVMKSNFEDIAKNALADAMKSG